MKAKMKMIAAALGIAATSVPVHAQVTVPIPDPVAEAIIVGSAVFQKNIERNVAAATNESGVGAQVLKGVTGISVKDAKEDIRGGNDSVIRKPLGTFGKKLRKIFG